MVRTRAALAVALLAAIAVATPAAAVEIALASDSPLQGEPVTVTVTDDGAPVAGARVEALYRPNSQTSAREDLAPTGADGRTEWTPSDAGIVTLAVLDPEREGATLASVNTAVRRGYFPASGIAVMIIAGLLLFGGAAIGMKMLLSEGPPAVEPPST